MFILTILLMSQNPALACNCAKKNAFPEPGQRVQNENAPDIKKIWCEMPFNWIIKNKANANNEYKVIGCAEETDCNSGGTEK